MEKKLPGIFANKVEGTSNNKKVDYYKSGETNIESEKTRLQEVRGGQNINQKLNYIFNSPKYVYKADVTIHMKDKILSKKIIGQNPTHLITIDNELIPISDIVDIYFTSEK